MELMLILIGLQLKHFIFDFLWQPKYEWSNKGTYGHLGGIIHSAKHVFGTAIVLYLCSASVYALVFLALLDGFIHYHVDWSKMNINAKWNLTAADNKFWILLGLDQLLHQITYILIVFILVGVL